MENLYKTLYSHRIYKPPLFSKPTEAAQYMSISRPIALPQACKCTCRRPLNTGTENRPFTAVGHGLCMSCLRRCTEDQIVSSRGVFIRRLIEQSPSMTTVISPDPSVSQCQKPSAKSRAKIKPQTFMTRSKSLHSIGTTETMKNTNSRFKLEIYLPSVWDG